MRTSYAVMAMEVNVPQTTHARGIGKVLTEVSQVSTI